VSAFDDDIDTMLADFDPVWLIAGENAGNAIGDTWDEEVLRGAEHGVKSGVLALLVRTSAFPDLRIGGDVLVQQKDAAGQPVASSTVMYRVLDRQRPIQYADGRLTAVLLQPR